MKLALTHLKDGENQFQGSSREPGWVSEIASQLKKNGYELEGPLDVEVTVHKHEPDYYIRGQLASQVRETCARCAEPFLLPLKYRFDVAMAHVEKNLQEAQNSEESEELDVYFFDGKEIDLGPIVEEQFALSVPYQSICKPDCQGICQYCGQNKNVGNCSCVSPDAVNPFGVLKKLKV